MMPPGSPKRASVRLWAAVWIAAFSVGLAVDGWVLTREPLATGLTDFHQFFQSTHAWRSGAPMYPPVAQGDRVVYNLNPPHFHFLILPLLSLSTPWAFAVWTLLGIACLAAVLWRILPPWFARLREPLWPVALFGWLFVTPITAAVLVTGAPVWVLLPLLWAARSAHQEGLLLRAGVLLGVLASIKPFLLLLLPWLALRGDWRAVTACTMTMLAAIGIGLAAFGPHAYADWWHGVRASEGWAWGQLNASLAALTSRSFSTTPYWAPLSTALPAWTIWMILVVAVLVVTAQQIGTVSLDRGWPLLIATSLLVNPLGWIYYIWWLIPLLIGRPLGAPTLAGFALLTVAPWAIFSGQPSVLLTVTLAASYVWGLLCVWAGLLVEPPAEHPAPAAAA